MSIQDTWNRLDTLFRQKYPGDVDFLLPGATLDEIEQIERYRSPVPEEIKAIWSNHNGEQWNAKAGIIPGFEILSIERIIQIQLVINKLTQERDLDENNELESGIFPDEAGKPYLFSTKTLVFADDSAANSLVLDFDPGPKGMVGQVSHIGPDEKPRYILASSLEAFFELLIWIYNDPRSVLVISDDNYIEFNWLNGNDQPITNLMALRHLLYQEGKLYQPSSSSIF